MGYGAKRLMEIAAEKEAKKKERERIKQEKEKEKKRLKKIEHKKKLRQKQNRRAYLKRRKVILDERKAKGDEYGYFSNFAHYDFELDGKRWMTSEHYFQAQKFFGTEYEIFGFKIKKPYYHLIDEGADYIISHKELDYGNTGT